MRYSDIVSKINEFRDVSNDQNFMKWFSGSKIVDSSGKPMPVFHGTLSGVDFDKFKLRPGDIGIHFGTKGQANDRIDYMQDDTPDILPRVIPVYLSIKNPLRLPDLGAWNPDNMDYALIDVFPNDEKIIRSLKSSAQVRNYIKSKGYDGVVYKNTGEVDGAESYRDAALQARMDFWNYQQDNGKPIGSISPEDQKLPLYKKMVAADKAYEQFREKNGVDSYIAFDPTQIKSVFSKEFNPKKKQYNQ